MLLRFRKFRRFVSISLLGIFGVVLLVAGDTTARIIGAVMLAWAFVLVVLWRKRIFFMFSSQDGSE